MEGYVKEIRGMIYAKFRSEADCAKRLGWNRQRLNKITTGKKIPDISEINQLASVLGEDEMKLYHIFLNAVSTNGQQSA